MISYNIIIGYVFITLGVFLNLIAALSLLRFPDVFSRLFGSTKGITLGTLSLLFGVFLIHGFTNIGIKALLCLVFILLTSPVETHVMLRASVKSMVKMWEGNTARNEGRKEKN